MGCVYVYHHTNLRHFPHLTSTVIYFTFVFKISISKRSISLFCDCFGMLFLVFMPFLFTLKLKKKCMNDINMDIICHLQ